MIIDLNFQLWNPLITKHLLEPHLLLFSRFEFFPSMILFDHKCWFTHRLFDTNDHKPILPTNTHHIWNTPVTTLSSSPGIGGYLRPLPPSAAPARLVPSRLRAWETIRHGGTLTVHSSSVLPENGRRFCVVTGLTTGDGLRLFRAGDHSWRCHSSEDFWWFDSRVSWYRNAATTALCVQTIWVNGVVNVGEKWRVTAPVFVKIFIFIIVTN